MFDWKTLHNFKMPVIRLALGLLVTLQLSFPRSAEAGTIVNFSSELGNFSVELFDDTTPVTVANFLGYVNSGRYDNLLVHRNILGFIFQAGLARVDKALGLIALVPTDPNIVNEFGVSNTRGTIAMAKLSGNPNSASSQWFINVGNNSSNLDGQNGGFTAFGRVLDNGMEVVDAINALFTADVDLPNIGIQSDLPLINFSGGTLTFDNLFELTVSVAAPAAIPAAPNRFDAASGLLNVQVDAGASGLAALSFAITATEPQVVIQALPDTVEVLSNTVDKIATFNELTGELQLPELEVDGTIQFYNLVFTLSDADQLLFTLVSFEE